MFAATTTTEPFDRRTRRGPCSAGAMASDDFTAFRDASLHVLRKSLLEAYSEANHRQSVEGLPRRLEADLHELKSDFRPSGGAASFNSSQCSQGRVSFKQQGAGQNSDAESEGQQSDDAPEARRMLSDQTEATEDVQGQEQDKALRKAMQQRLQVRLNVLSATQLVSGRNLHDAVGALGLTTYTIEDMNTLVKALAKYIDLRLVKKEEPKLLRSQTSNSMFSAQGPENMRALWHWPVADKPRPSASRSTENSLTSPTTPTTKSFESEKSEENLALTVVPAKALMELFTTKDVELPKQVFRQQMVLNQFQAMREILVAGDTNRLVAELTFVRINDLAAPPEALDPLFYIEPVVAVLIVVNGIMIGFQTDRAYEAWSGWPYIETVFAVLLVLECIVRFSLSGAKQFFCGPDFHWNLFDMFLVLTAVTDVVFQLAFPEQDADMAGASLLRFCRLIRLVRVVKVFRLNYMKDLRLMVKGLVGGIRTLLLSFALLFAVLYVISGFATMTLGRDERTQELGLQTHFENIPKSMFTAFRCFSGECFADSGVPIASVLSTNLGWGFVLCYVVSYMLVSMGIFNVILAVYVDITMRAAKETEISTAEQYARESIRIARTTRELLKKFAEAHRVFYDRERDDGGRETMMKSLELSTSHFLDDAHIDDIAITKELFLLVIQDQRVQQLMNDLDLPADRANLFEVIDADASGTLHVTELVQGLLKIRGDLTKSDTVAVLLTAKSVHTMVAELKAEQQNFRAMLLELFSTQEALRKSLKGSGLKSIKGPNPKVNFMRRTAEQLERKLARSESGMSGLSPPSPPSPSDFEPVEHISAGNDEPPAKQCGSVLVALG
eukprot:s12_g36.t1